MTVLRRRGMRLSLVLIMATLVGVLSLAPRPVRAQAAAQLAARADADSGDAQLSYQVALAYWKEKNWDQAERYLRRAVACSPQYAEALLALGQIAVARGEKWWKQYEKANGHVAADSLIDRYVAYQRRAFMVNELVDLSIMGEVDIADYFFTWPGSYGTLMRVWWVRPWQRAATMLHQGDAAGSYRLLDSIIHVRYFAEDPKSIPGMVLWYHGHAAARTKNWDAAINDFAVLTGRSFDAEKTFNIPVALFPTNQYRYALGTMLYQAGRYNQAAPVFRRVLELDLGMYPAHVQLARMLEADGDWQGAIEERQAAIDAFPEDATLHIELAETQYRSGRPDIAIMTLQDAMAVNSCDYRIPLLLGNWLVAAGRGSEAKEPYERFLATAPSRLTAEKAQVKATLAGP